MSDDKINSTVDDRAKAQGADVKSTENDDATRVAVKNLTPEQKAAIIKRREQQKAAALAEHRAKQAIPPQEADDRTRIASRPPQAAQDDRTVIKKPLSQNSDDDKTRFAPQARAPKATPEAPEDQRNQTQFKPRPKIEEAGDETKFQVRATAPTVVSEVPDPAQTKIQPIDGAENAATSNKVDVLKERFILGEVLGAGGMGVVYKAKDLLKVQAEDRDPYVAIKVLGEEFKSHPEAFIALQRESRKTQRIAHPNIVNVHDFDKDGDTVFMTMEFLSGKPLDKLIKQYKSTGLAPEDAENILQGLCSALAYAHDQNIIHSDLKPGNIFVTEQNVCKVFDFGIARAVAKADTSNDDKEDKTVFDAGNLGALTPAYASLEMLEGEEPDIRDDIYALGCIAYELYAGVHPFNRVNAKEAHSQGLKPKRLDNISKRKWQVIQKALAFERESRVAHAEEFWKLFTAKRSNTGVVAFIAFAAVAAMAYLMVFNKPVVEYEQVDTAEIRNQANFEARLNLVTETVTQLLDDPAFDERWEKSLKDRIAELTELLSAEDEKVLDVRQKASALYLARIRQEMDEAQFEQATLHIENSRIYHSEQTAVNALSEELAQLIAEAEKRAEEERIAREAAEKKARELRALKQDKAKRKKAFDVALATVNKQLGCHSGLNMRDFDIAIDKLRSLNASRYRKLEPGIIHDLAACITDIGKNIPERGEEAKKVALRTFKGHKTIRDIKIVPRDPCDGLAGLGARGSRSSCTDTIAGIGKSPQMVVIPAKGSIKEFALSKYEITVKEFNEFCKDTKSCELRGGDASIPMTNVPLDKVQAYAKWLTGKTGETYRLPKKSEWLHAARATKQKVDPNRQCLLDTRGIKIGGSLVKARVGDPNPWGLHNMIGNASEWVNIRAGKVAAVGGSYDTPMEECTIKTMSRSDGSADPHIGFRLVRERVKNN